MEEQLKKIIENSDLRGEEAKEFLAILPFIKKKDDLFNLLAFLEAHPEWVLKLYRNYKIKQIYFSTKDEKGLQKIFKDEVKELQDIAKDEANAK